MSDFVNSQQIVYELKPSSRRRVPSPPDGFKEAKQLNDIELDRVNKIPFLRLLGGKEPLKNVRMRYDLYKKNWNRQLQAINAVLLKTDRFKFRSLREFISIKRGAKFDTRLTTGFLNLGSNISNHDRLLSNVCRYLREDQDICLVRINPLVCNNIQKVMKRIEDSVAYKLQTYDSQYNLKKRSKNKGGSNKRRFIPTDDGDGPENNKVEDSTIDINQYDSDDELKESSDEEQIDYEMRLNQFDLLPKNIEKEFFEDTEDMLLKFKEKGITLVVLIQNADSMSSLLIEQCLSLLHKYNTISDVCCTIGISTPFIIFQEKISKLLISKLKTKSFAIDNSNEAINQIMEDLLLNINETYNSLIFDPKLVLKFLYKRDVMSIQQFNNNMKMIYMRHYYSQPLSVFWTNDFSKIDLKSIYFTIFKTLPSVIENSKEIDQKHLIGIADNNVQLIGDMLRTNLNKLINWRYEFRNLIDFLNFIQASILQDMKIWNNNLELFQMLFEKYYELRDAEDNWNDIDDDEHDVDSNIDDLIQESGRKKSKVEKKLSNALMSRINPVTLTNFLNPIWKSLQTMENKEIKSFYKQLCSDEQFHFITRSNKFPSKCPYGSKSEFIKSIQISLRNRVCELDLDYQPFREICVVREDAIWKIHDAFEPCVMENSLKVLDDPGKILFNSTHWVDNDELKKIDVKMFHFVEPILCEMYRIFKETGVNTNVYDFYQVFQNSIMRRKELVRLLNVKLDKLRSNDDIDTNEFDFMKMILNNTESELDAGIEDEWSRLTLSWFLKSLAEFQIIGLLREGSSKSQAIEKVMWRGI
ncbi:hypothetical protein CANINC_000984 [Pichia inconspicua]|uniref:Uncharacterized protein n=1 Tax=Pichia inconspicua TaxID=52247 RepID=A0A4T0X5C0_9ASCO|nr:hypothetical protein CANINC_000984 [[Candida] inconspicua]